MKTPYCPNCRVYHSKKHKKCRCSMCGTALKEVTIKKLRNKVISISWFITHGIIMVFGFISILYGAYILIQGV